MFQAPLDVLAPDAIEAVHDQAMRILEEIGVEVGADGGDRPAPRRPARPSRARACGWTAGSCSSRWRRRPTRFTLRPRNPAREVHLGGGSMVLTPVGGSPFCSDLERGRRDGTLDAYVELTKLAHAADEITCLQSGVTEASELSEMSRYLDLDYACLRWSDKPYVCYGTAGEKAQDAVRAGGDRVRRPRRDRHDAGDHRHRQPEQPAGVGLADGRVPDGVGGGRAAGGDDAVHAGGRDGAGVARRGAVAADRRGAVAASRWRSSCGRARPACTARSSPASTCAAAGPRWGCRRACWRRSPAASWRGTTGSRTAAAAGSAPATRSTRSRRTRRRWRCGRRTTPAPTWCCTRRAGSRAA